MFASHEAQREFYEMMQTFEVVGGFRESNLNVILNPTIETIPEDPAEGVAENSATSADQEIEVLQPRTADASTQTDAVEAPAAASPVIVYDYSWSAEEKDKVFALIKALIVQQEKAEQREREINSLRRKLRIVLKMNSLLHKFTKKTTRAEVARVINGLKAEDLNLTSDSFLEETQITVAQVNTWKSFFRSLSCI